MRSSSALVQRELHSQDKTRRNEWFLKASYLPHTVDRACCECRRRKLSGIAHFRERFLPLLASAQLNCGEMQAIDRVSDCLSCDWLRVYLVVVAEEHLVVATAPRVTKIVSSKICTILKILTPIPLRASMRLKT